jgi:hypothetical protein
VKLTRAEVRAWALRQLDVERVDLGPLGADFTRERRVYLALVEALRDARDVADAPGSDPWSFYVRELLGQLTPEARANVDVHIARPMTNQPKTTPRGELVALFRNVTPTPSHRMLALIGIVAHDEWILLRTDTITAVLDREINDVKQARRRHK